MRRRRCIVARGGRRAAPRSALAPHRARARGRADGGDRRQPTRQSVESELRQAEEHYDKAIKGLEQITNADQGALDPKTAATLQKNLAVIDQAISESRAAVHSQPTTSRRKQSLLDSFKTKIGLLQDTVALINEMRKGNDAGAARIVSGLKQKGDMIMRLHLSSRRGRSRAHRRSGGGAVRRSASTCRPSGVIVPDVANAVTTRAYQGRNNGPEQTERFSRKIKLGRDGRVSVQNIAGDIMVTAGSGDELSIEAVKRTRGDQSQLASVHIDVDERAGRVDVRTTHTGDETISVVGRLHHRPAGVGERRCQVDLGQPEGVRSARRGARGDGQRQRHDGRHAAAREREVGVGRRARSRASRPTATWRSAASAATSRRRA